MPSNALSGKSFNTATPAVCHKGPLPKIVPPPPLTKIVFYCFATFQSTNWEGVGNFAGVAHLYYKPAQTAWIGISGSPNARPSITATLRTRPNPNGYDLLIAYHFPEQGGVFVEWNDQRFNDARPYVGSQLESLFAYKNQIRRAIVREIPS